MSAADLARVLEIGESLQEAPKWPVATYVAALDPLNLPRRIALVAEWGSPLKGHGFSRAAGGPNNDAALAAEVMQVAEGTFPQGLKPSAPHQTHIGAAEAAPFQNSGPVVGFAVASLVAPEAELETMGVASEGQRRGVGARLLQALVEELRAERVTELMLEVRASNCGALAFYRARGFRETGRRVRYYADPEEDAVLMGLWVG